MTTSSASPSPIDASPHILSLLSHLHKLSLDQEAILSPKTGKVFSTDFQSTDGHNDKDNNLEPSLSTSSAPKPDFDTLMLDKFIALDEDKCHFLYQLITAMSATTVVEAGTSLGVSTIYLALAVGKVKDATGKKGTVIATEKEEIKAERARTYWKECGEVVEREIDLRIGDLRETLKEGLPEEGVDLLLLDIWAALALPTLKVVLPKLRYGAVVLTDNIISGAKGYADLLAFLRAPENGFYNTTLPYTNGFEMSVYLPKRE